MLARCFDDNKSVNYIVRQDRRRAERILYLMEYAFDYCMLLGEVFLSDDKQGCALIVLPGKVKSTLRSTLLDIRLIFRSVEQSLPIYLETSVNRNVPFYERAGFAIYNTLDLGYTLYCMKRAARLYAD